MSERSWPGTKLKLRVATGYASSFLTLYFYHVIMMHDGALRRTVWLTFEFNV